MTLGVKAGSLCASLALVGLGLTAAPAAATFPGANGRIVYVESDRYRDIGQIATVEPDGTDVQILTQGKQNQAPQFFPNGKRIAYVHQLSRRQARISVMRVDGTNKHDLTKNHNDFSPAPSPDGRRIAFQRLTKTGRKELCVMNGDGTHVHVIDRVTGQPANFTWSPSGDVIAFDSGFSEEIDVFLERTDGTGRREIVNAEDPSFSPDGKRLALIHQDSIETTDLHGTDPLSLSDNLTPGFGFFENPRISPDGALVTFAAGQGFRSPSDIYVMAPGASTALKVTTSGKADSPDWGPAG